MYHRIDYPRRQGPSAAELLEASKKLYVQTEFLKRHRIDPNAPRLFRTPSEEELRRLRSPSAHVEQQSPPTNRNDNDGVMFCLASMTLDRRPSNQRPLRNSTNSAFRPVKQQPPRPPKSAELKRRLSQFSDSRKENNPSPPVYEQVPRVSFRTSQKETSATRVVPRPAPRLSLIKDMTSSTEIPATRQDFPVPSVNGVPSRLMAKSDCPLRDDPAPLRSPTSPPLNSTPLPAKDQRSPNKAQRPCTTTINRPIPPPRRRQTTVVFDTLGQAHLDRAFHDQARGPDRNDSRSSPASRESSPGRKSGQSSPLRLSDQSSAGHQTFPVHSDLFNRSDQSSPCHPSEQCGSTPCSRLSPSKPSSFPSCNGQSSPSRACLVSQSAFAERPRRDAVERSTSAANLRAAPQLGAAAPVQLAIPAARGRRSAATSASSTPPVTPSTNVDSSYASHAASSARPASGAGRASPGSPDSGASSWLPQPRLARLLKTPLTAAASARAAPDPPKTRLLPKSSLPAARSQSMHQRRQPNVVLRPVILAGAEQPRLRSRTSENQLGDPDFEERVRRWERRRTVAAGPDFGGAPALMTRSWMCERNTSRLEDLDRLFNSQGVDPALLSPPPAAAPFSDDQSFSDFTSITAQRQRPPSGEEPEEEAEEAEEEAAVVHEVHLTRHDQAHAADRPVSLMEKNARVLRWIHGCSAATTQC